MKGDFTRNTFDPGKHYSRVLMQQGRVQLDADWNEQGAIFSHDLRTLARDLIGPHGTPERTDANGNVIQGFQIVTAGFLDADGNLLPSTDPLFQTLSNAVKKGAFVVNPGVYYVDGIRVENTTATAFLPTSTAAGTAAGAAAFLVYLDVWERHVTCLEDAHIREVALGGPDTATRAKVVWQVKTCAMSSNSDAPCGLDNVPKQPGTERLRAYAGQGSTPSTPCSIAPSSSYRGAENQLYRVEIHQGGTIGDANNPVTFKWSRENGSVVFPVIGAVGASSGGANPSIAITLGTLGRDDKLGLHVGDWVELFDDDYVMQNRADPLLQVTKIDKDDMQVTLAGTTSVAADADQRNVLLRRWDQHGAAIAVKEIAAGNADYTDSSKWFALEDGIVVCFVSPDSANDPPRRYCTGDYWLIPARVATGDIEWPQTPNGSVEVAAAIAPDGPQHHYAPLAHGDADDGFASCRFCFGAIASQCPEIRRRTAAPAPARPKKPAHK